MKTPVVILFFFSFLNFIESSAQIRSYGFDVTLKSFDTLDEYYDVLVNPDGSFYVVGMDSLNSSSSDDGHNAVLCKFNADFSLAWRRVYGGSKRDWFDKIKPYKDGYILVAGSTASNDGDVTYGYDSTSWCAWLTIMDSTGNVIHGNVWGYGNPTSCMDINITSDKKVFLTGSTVAFLGDFISNTGPFLTDQFFVALADSQLNKQWVKVFVNQDVAFGTKSCMLKNDTLVASLYTPSISGDYNIGAPLGDWDVIWFYLDTNQNILKKRRLGGTNGEGGIGIYSIDSTNIVSVTSTTSLNGTFYSNEIPSTSTAPDWSAITKINQHGQVVWNHLYGPFGSNLTPSFTYGMLKMCVTKDRYWTTGYIAGTDEGWVGPPSGIDTLDGYGDGFLWQHDTSGNLLRKLRIGDFHFENNSFVGQMKNGNFVLGVPSLRDWNSMNPFSCYPSKSCFKLYELKEWPVATNNIKATTQMELTVYPNPTNHKVTVNFLKGNNDKIEVRVYTQTGTIVRQITTRAEQNDIDIESLPPGIYSVEVIYNTRNFHSSFLKQ